VELLAVVVVIVVGVAVVVVRRARRRSGALQQRFGQEYNRLVASEGGDRRAAEGQLRELTKRRKTLDIRDLSPERKANLSARWREAQLGFVDDPAASVAAADALVDEIARRRGYPGGDVRERIAMLTVDHPRLIENYRTARAIKRRSDERETTIDLLRVAFRSYRSLFVELMGDGKPTSRTRAHG
jgi:hypothetical protein